MGSVIANLVCFTRTADRVERAERELLRVGASEVRRWWNFPNPFDAVLLSQMPHTKLMDGQIGFFNASVTHYRIIKTSLELGEDRVLVCEDDVRFRKDIARIDDILAFSQAASADVLLLDGIPPKKGLLTPLRDIGNGFAEFDSMRSGACYVLSRKGMERIVWLYESAVDRSVRGRKARIGDQWFEREYLKGLNLVMAYPNAAIQQTVPGHHNSGNKWRLVGYSTLGINVDDYTKY